MHMYVFKGFALRYTVDLIFHGFIVNTVTIRKVYVVTTFLANAHREEWLGDDKRSITKLVFQKMLAAMKSIVVCCKTLTEIWVK